MTTHTARSIQEPARSIPVFAEYDVLVVGGGPAGPHCCPCRRGRRTAGGPDRKPQLRRRQHDDRPAGAGLSGTEGQPDHRGPAAEIHRPAAKARNGASEHRPCPLHMGITLVEPEAVKTVALEMLTEAGVDVLFYTFCAGVVMDGDTIRGIITESKSGRDAILGKGGDRLHRRRGRGVSCGCAVREGKRERRHAAADAHVLPGRRRHRQAAHEHRQRAQGGAHLSDGFHPGGVFRPEPPVHRRRPARTIAKAQTEMGLKIPNERTIIITGLAKGKSGST